MNDSAEHGFAENLNLHFLSGCHTLLSPIGLSDSLWFEYVAFVTLLCNFIIHSSTKMYP